MKMRVEISRKNRSFSKTIVVEHIEQRKHGHSCPVCVLSQSVNEKESPSELISVVPDFENLLEAELVKSRRFQ